MMPIQDIVAEYCRLRDLETTEYNPFMLLLPFQSRNWVQHYIAPWYVLALNAAAMPIVLVKQVCFTLVRCGLCGLHGGGNKR